VCTFLEGKAAKARSIFCKSSASHLPPSGQQCSCLMHAVLEASAILHERVVHLVSLVDPCDRRQGTVHDRFHSKRLSSFESNSSGHAYRAPEKETEMEHGHQRETTPDCQASWYWRMLVAQKPKAWANTAVSGRET
jgi:hypothetical protein